MITGYTIILVCSLESSIEILFGPNFVLSFPSPPCCHTHHLNSEHEHSPAFSSIGQSMQANVDCWFTGLADHDALEQFCIDNYHKYISLVEIMPNCSDILQFTNEITDDHTYIITNCPRKIVELILASEQGTTALASHLKNTDGSFRVICAGDVVKNATLLPKPSTSMILHMSSTSSVSAHETLLGMFGCSNSFLSILQTSLFLSPMSFFFLFFDIILF